MSSFRDGDWVEAGGQVSKSTFEDEFPDHAAEVRKLLLTDRKGPRGVTSVTGVGPVTPPERGAVPGFRHDTWQWFPGLRELR